MVLKIGAKVDSEVLNKCSLQNKIKIAAALTNSTDTFCYLRSRYVGGFDPFSIQCNLLNGNLNYYGKYMWNVLTFCRVIDSMYSMADHVTEQ